MNKITLFVFVLILFACANSESEQVSITQSSAPVVLSYEEHAAALRDSALRISLSANDEVAIREGLRLFDEAMDMDPNSKTIFYSKMKILSDHRMYDEVFQMLKRLDTLEFKDAYSTLQLAIEYELRNDMNNAEEKYIEAAEGFYQSIIAIEDQTAIERSNLLLNLAVAERLSENVVIRVPDLLTEQEKIQLGSILIEIEERDREEVLNANRIKLKPRKRN